MEDLGGLLRNALTGSCIMSQSAESTNPFNP